MKINSKVGSFAGGLLFGTAGLALLGSDGAKKVYAHCTAAVLRAKDYVLDKAANVQANAGDVAAEAKDINEKIAAKKAAAVHKKEEASK